MRTVCCVPGCPELAERGSRCATHRLRASGSTYAWRRLRARVLRRDGYRCQRCGAPAVDVHHVVPVVLGGRDHESNLVSVCERCHGELDREALRSGGASV